MEQWKQNLFSENLSQKNAVIFYSFKAAFDTGFLLQSFSTYKSYK